MDLKQLPQCFDRWGHPIKASAKAKEVFARCVEQIERWPTSDTDNVVALRLKSVADENVRTFPPLVGFQRSCSVSSRSFFVDFPFSPTTPPVSVHSHFWVC